MTKQHFELCMSEYSDKELIQFHANLNALFLCCSEDFHLFPLLLKVTSVIQDRKTSLTSRYMDAVDNMLQIPEDYKYKNQA